ncbi:hypothetical protein QUF61_03010 [Candidatus Venteria ishoeyi]|uniref:hypothetical protein n=1 Tax=Candidatus Venteria ishoeyi TaxID=1899563 RepID=UPI0025A68451|nr:hypothetical protein [Candidatus Venteria ishoeyi]MDM8545442.1 hypothetical protein [Candidatus Venteria ishoeyi]
MKKNLTFVAGSLLGGLILVACQPDAIKNPKSGLSTQQSMAAQQATVSGQLNHAEVLALFNDRSVEGRNLIKQFTFKAWYTDDGLVRQRVTKGGESVRLHGWWHIDEQGRHCLKWSGRDEHCRIIIQEDDMYKKIYSSPNGEQTTISEFWKFADGNFYGL